MKKVYVLFFLIFACTIFSTEAQLLQWNTFGNLGTETTEPSVFNDANLSGVTNLTLGAGVTAAANGNRFGGSNWWNTGNSVNSILTEAIAGNDYIEFIVTPNGGFSFTPTSLVFFWDRSGTGPQNVTLRSSADGFTSDLGTVLAMTSGGASTTTPRTLTITTLTNIVVATTFRLYGYGGTATGGTGGFDNASSVVNIQLNGTTASGGLPTVNVTPTSLIGFSALSGVPTAEQTYTVGGSNLTNDIIITPPVGFQIATVSGGPYTTNPASITLTQTGGNVPSTTIYVRMNSATLGSNTGNITNTSTGSNNPNVALSGNVLAAEPTVQSAITFGAVTNSTIIVNFSGGNGAKRILVAKALTAVNSNPVDGTTYTANSIFGLGTQLGTGNYAVYVGTGNTQLVSGLTAGTTYHFAVYEFNDGGAAGAENYLIPGGTGSQATIDVPVIYTWNGGNGLWTTPGNWTPVRLFPGTNDILLFLDGTTETVTDVPNQSIGQLHVTLGTQVTLQAAAASTVLTLNGNIPFEDFTVDATSSLTIGGANSFVVNLATGTNGIIDGAVSLIGTAGSAHKLTAADVDGISFNTSSKFTAGAGLSGNPFGNGTAGSVVFISGSEMEQVSGANPFAIAAGVVTFQTGSLYKVTGGATFTPSFSGRTYANVEIDNAAYFVSSTGGGALSIDNLTITNGIQNLNLTGGISIKGDISVAVGATLTFSPTGVNTLNFDGPAPQSISNLGTLTFNANENITINNSNGITLNAPITWLGVVTFTSGLLNTDAVNLLTLGNVSSVTGTSNASFVNGPVKKIGNTAFTFPIGKSNGLVPLRVSNFAGASAPTDQFTAEYIRASAAALGTVTAPLIDHVSYCEYWNLNVNNGTPTVDITLYWTANNTCGGGAYITNRNELEIAHFNGTNWNSSSTGFSATNGTAFVGDIVWPGVSVFSPFALASSTNGDNPLPITINYFSGTKNNGNHLLNWKVTCVSTPSATLEMERSTDGINFSSVYSIFATALRCADPFDYTDNQPAKGVNYYRLKMISADGKVTYSSIVTLINSSKGIGIMNIAPNPIVNGSFNLKISTAEKTQMELVITDMQGRVMQRKPATMIAGFNTIPMQVGNLAAGTYQLFGISADGRTKVLRFVIQ